MASAKILKQGAEAKLYLGDYQGQPCLIKERFPKLYRHPELDKQLTKERMRSETKALARCLTAGILVPRVFNMDLDTRRIHMEYFGRSRTVKQHILNFSSKPEQQEAVAGHLELLGTRIGDVIGKMHVNNIIHGDLTTSNMLLEPKAGDDSGEFAEYSLVMIDFGLAHYHTSAEDKVVDLYVLERALLSTHSAFPQLFDSILVAYRLANNIGCQEVIGKFEEVRARGRKRTMVGWISCFKIKMRFKTDVLWDLGPSVIIFHRC